MTKMDKLITDHDDAIAALRIVAEALHEIPQNAPFPAVLSSALKATVKAVQDTHDALTAELE